MKRVYLCLVAAGLLLGGGVISWLVVKSHRSPTKEERQLVELMNAARAQENLPPMTLDASLCTVARALSDKMARDKKLLDPLDQKAMAAQLSAAGYDTDDWSVNIDALNELNVAAIFANWQEAPLTSDEMLAEAYQDCGVAIVPDARQEKFYYTMVFGARKEKR